MSQVRELATTGSGSVVRDVADDAVAVSSMSAAAWSTPVKSDAMIFRYPAAVVDATML